MVALLWTLSNLATWSQNTICDCMIFFFFLIFFFFFCITKPTDIQLLDLFPPNADINLCVCSVLFLRLGWRVLTWAQSLAACLGWHELSPAITTCSVRVGGSRRLNGGRWGRDTCSRVSVTPASDKGVCLSHQQNGGERWWESCLLSSSCTGKPELHSAVLILQKILNLCKAGKDYWNTQTAFLSVTGCYFSSIYSLNYPSNP